MILKIYQSGRTIYIVDGRNNMFLEFTRESKIYCHSSQSELIKYDEEALCNG